jgi:hypothetical protein
MADEQKRAMADVTKLKAQVWVEFQRSRAKCPFCGKCITMRALRWKHNCGKKVAPAVRLDASSEKERREELHRRAVQALELRMQKTAGVHVAPFDPRRHQEELFERATMGLKTRLQRNGETAADRRADQGGVRGAGQAGT